MTNRRLGEIFRLMEDIEEEIEEAEHQVIFAKCDIRAPRTKLKKILLEDK